MAGAFWQCSGGGIMAVAGDIAGLGAGGFLRPDESEYGAFISRPGRIDLLTYQVDGNARTGTTTFSLSGHSGAESNFATLSGGATGPVTVAGSFTVAEGDEVFGLITPPFVVFETINVGAIGLRFTATDPTITCSRFTANGSVIFSAGTSWFVALVGALSGVTTEAEATFRPGAGATDGTLHYASVFVHANSLDADCVVTVRVAGSDTPIVVTIPSGQTGWWHDTEHTSDVTALQSATYDVDASAATSGSITIRAMHVDFLTTTGIWTSGLGQQGRNPAGDATLDLAIGGVNDFGGPQTLPLGATILAMGLYVSGNLTSTPSALTWVSNGVESSLVVPVSAAATGPFQASGRAVNAAGAEALIRFAVGGPSGLTYECIWFAGTYTVTGVIGPLAWAHMTRRTPDGSLATDTYSDQDMQCPGEWENGFKAARVLHFGPADRALSDRWSGEWTGATCRVTLSDYDFRFRQQFAGTQNRYWTRAGVVRMTSRANRAVLGVPYTVFCGYPVELQPARPLAFEVTLADRVTRSLLDDANQIPWRHGRDGLLGHLDTIAEHFDYETPEPIIYGQHIRTTLDPASGQGYIYAPTYYGIIGSEHVWVIAGHACAEIPNIYVDDGSGPASVLSDIGTDWRTNGHDGEPLYYDYRSIPYGNDRRYTLIFGTVGNANPDACAKGERTLFVSVYGVETVGDGTGDLILDRIQQYKHFAINFIAHHGRESYQGGEWLSNPIEDMAGISVEAIDEDSFDLASYYASLRYPVTTAPNPAGGFYPAGYLGAAIIGAHAGDRASVRRWIAEWNRSCAVRNGFTNLDRYRVVMCHPTQAAKDAAPLYTDATEILEDSFGADLVVSEQVNRVPFRADYEHRSGSFTTTGVASWDLSVSNYEREITADPQEYPFAPGIAMAFNLALLEVRQRADPPRPVTLRTGIGPDVHDDSLAYRELGDYIRYRAYPAVANGPTEIRLAQIERMRIDPSGRWVEVQCLDLDDLVGFDIPAPVGDDGTELSTCATATVLTPGLDPFPYQNFFTIDTRSNPTDTSVSALLAPHGVIAHNAAWFVGTAPAHCVLSVSSGGSDYDTFIAIFTGDCENLVFAEEIHGDDAFNDNIYLLLTSGVAVNATEGETYRILVGSVHDGGGALVVTAQFQDP